MIRIICDTKSEKQKISRILREVRDVFLGEKRKLCNAKYFRKLLTTGIYISLESDSEK